MRINYTCLPCLVNQVVKVADMTKALDREKLFKEVFNYMGTLDFNKTNPEVIGDTFRILKKHIGNNDPYLEVRNYYNDMFLKLVDNFQERIDKAENPFHEAVMYAILGNLIDFNPMHNNAIEDILQYFERIQDEKLTINHVSYLLEDIKGANKLLYLGDNCGEICLDLLFIKKIKEINPKINIYFGVRGSAVVNDSIEEDAYYVGIDKYAQIISNGDDSLGTVLSRTSEEFNKIYHEADVVIAKGQANYESLSEEVDKNIYFMLMTKCEVIANYVGVPQKSLVCMKLKNSSYSKLGGKMNTEEILKLIESISPHARAYVAKAFENNHVEVLNSILTEENKGVFIKVEDEGCSIFYASFINEHDIGDILEIIKKKTKEYVSKSHSKEICFNVYGENLKIVNLVKELGFKPDMEGYHMEYRGQEIPKLSHYNLNDKGFDSSMIKQFVDLFDQAYYQLNLDNGWRVNSYAINEERFHKKLNELNNFNELGSFWLNDELVGAYIFQQNYITDIVVSQKFQGKGYGSYILAYCIRAMKENKSIKNIRLRVAKSNIGAKKLYERNGFLQIATFAEHSYE